MNRRSAIFASNYGRTSGWTVSQNQELVAELVEPIEVDMFWVSYRVIDLGVGDWRDIGFWERDGVTICSRLTGEPVHDWLVSPRFADGRASFRGLYLDPGFPRFRLPWEWRRSIDG